MADVAATFMNGVAAMESGDAHRAERAFRSIVSADPRAHQAWYALSVLAQKTDRNADAVECALRAVHLERRNVEYLNALGVAYLQAGHLPDAEKALRRALNLRPVYPMAMFNLGRVLEKAAGLADAQRAYERARATGGRFPELYAALAQQYRRQGRLDLAIAVLDQGLQGPHEAILTPNMADCLADRDGLETAIEWLRQAERRHPKYPDIKFKLGHLLLAAGRWRQGWKYYAWRGLEDDQDVSGKHLPERLARQRVQLVGEQGMGDVLFFLRFLRQLSDRGAVVDLCCEPKLAALLTGDARFSGVFATDEPPPNYTYLYRFSLGDLPGLLGTGSCPPAFPLSSDPVRRQRCEQRLAALGAPPYLGSPGRQARKSCASIRSFHFRSRCRQPSSARLCAAGRGPWYRCSAIPRRPTRR